MQAMNISIRSVRPFVTHGGKIGVDVFGVIRSITQGKTIEGKLVLDQATKAYPEETTLVAETFWAESLVDAAKAAGKGGVLQIVCDGLAPLPAGVIEDAEDLADPASELGQLQRRNRMNHFTADGTRKYKLAGVRASLSSVLKAGPGLEQIQTKAVANKVEA